MKKNMGSVDRVVRVVAALVVLALFLAGQITGPAAIILGVVAVVFVLTSAVATCPLYLPFGLSTRGKSETA